MGAMFLPARRRFPQGNGQGWSPLDLGPSLFAWWDAERADLITQSGGAVSSWKDVVSGYEAVQAIGASKPSYGATSFGGRPGITGDGVDDELTLAPVPAGIPTGSAPCELWAVVDQQALPADTTGRQVLTYGQFSATNRLLVRNVSGGANRSALSVGNGSTGVGTTNTSVDFSGRHIMRAVISSSAIKLIVDGIGGAGAGVPVVPATTTERLRLFASASPAATGFWQGALNTVLFTDLLSDGVVARLYANLLRRL